MRNRSYKLRGYTVSQIRALVKTRPYGAVAQIIGCSRQAVHSFCRYYDIWVPRSNYPFERAHPYDHDRIASMIKRRYSSKQITKVLHCSRGTVYYVMRSRGLSLYNPLSIIDDKKWLKAKYVKEGLSIERIARLIHVSCPTVKRRLILFHIKIRPKGRYSYEGK